MGKINMKKQIGNIVVEYELTPSELAEMEAQQQKAEAEYWQSISYEDAVNAEIRKQYTESAEFAILRQKDEKPNEYAEYYTYCEQCKTFVKAQQSKYHT
jgi:hypothetical protein